MRIARPILLFSLPVITIAFVGCNSDGRTLRPARPDQTGSVYTTTTTSTVPTQVIDGSALDPALETPALAFVLNLPWEEGGAIDPRYTCDGADIQPGFSWLGAPADAVEMALVVVDTDADDVVHWVVAGLDPNDPFVGENSVPVGAIEGRNQLAATPAVGQTTTTLAGALPDDADIGWSGPCPPAGTSHHYLFSLYALAQQLELPTGSDAADMQAAIDAVALSVTHRTGVYPGT